MEAWVTVPKEQFTEPPRESGFFVAIDGGFWTGCPELTVTVASIKWHIIMFSSP